MSTFQLLPGNNDIYEYLRKKDCKEWNRHRKRDRKRNDRKRIEREIEGGGGGA